MPLDTSPTRRGFVLVMTLMLLAIAVVALSAVARSSVGLAVDAVQARRDLQSRWGAYSSQRAALSVAPMMLQAKSPHSGVPPTAVSLRITLNGQAMVLTIADEQAKANVNALLAHLGRDATRSSILEQLGGNTSWGEISLPLVGPPTKAEAHDTATSVRRVIVSYNHMLPAFDPCAESRINAPDGHGLDTLTCWGDGRINLLRAPDEVVLSLTRPILGAIGLERLRKALAGPGNVTLHDALILAGLTREQARQAAKRLTLVSRCYSAWVGIDDGKRVHHHLAVLELEPPGGTNDRRHDNADVNDLDMQTGADALSNHSRDDMNGDAPSFPRLLWYRW